MIDEAASVGTSPWPLSVLFGGLVDPSRLSCLLALGERRRTVKSGLSLQTPQGGQKFPAFFLPRPRLPGRTGIGPRQPRPGRDHSPRLP